MSAVIAPGEFIAGQKVVLRLLLLDDCTPGYVAWLNDPAVNRYMEARWERQTLESVRAFVSSRLGSDRDFLFAIEERTTRRHIGNTRVGPVDPIHLNADISYFIGERGLWGRGYGTEAVDLGLRFGFERLGLHKMQAGVYAGNLASARVLVKTGFQKEGCMRKMFRSTPGWEWEDHIWYGILQEEWEAGQTVSMGEVK